MKISILFPENSSGPLTNCVPRWNAVKQTAWRIAGTILLALLMNALVFLPTYAQLQQSGGAGSSVTITGSLPTGSNVIGHVINDAGAAVIGHVIVDTTSTTAVTQATGTNLHAVLDSGTLTTLTTLTGITNALPTGSNVIGTVNTIPKTACGNTVASQALAAVPTSSTAVFTATTCMMVIILNNTNGSSATVTVTDNAGTPINNNLTFSIPANSQLIQPMWGVAFTTGMKWSASTTGITGAALGYS